jgi:DNA-binding LacI/PurR family transcriptional regulator
VIQQKHELLHASLARYIENEIVSEKMQPGDKLQSINKICNRFDVCSQTAVRAIDNLKERGIVESIPKKGTFVKALPTVSRKKQKKAAIKNIIVVSCWAYSSSFVHRMHYGIKDEAQKNGLTVQIEEINDSSINTAARVPFKAGPEDAVILTSNNPNIISMMLISAPQNRCIAVDTILPFAGSVLSDNFSGMRDLIEHLKKLGHNHIGLCTAPGRSPNFINNNQRTMAFDEICRQKRIKNTKIPELEGKSINKFFNTPDRPTAVMFMQDDPALKFIKDAEKRGYKIPKDLSVTGFDNFSRQGNDLSHLTTLEVEAEQLGSKAVETLLKQNTENIISNNWVTIPGRLIERNSTCKV